ncbi:Flp family type IVb pilin [Comamonas terrae]|uniref:Flp family type IVb pilin n=1 Tax=Comamonas terrae TaxID=673548 RepID=A0ABW5UL03_9BURK|nr:Flp family type IVb pilin [Comamonas terrae]
MTNFIKNFWKDEEGATAIEYGLIAGLIAVAIIATVTTLGGQLDSIFQSISDKLPKKGTGGTGGTGTGTTG